MCPTKNAKLKQSIRHEINQIPPKPKTPIKSKKKIKNKKSLSEDSSYLWCDVFALSKIAFFVVFFSFGGKIIVSI